MVKIHKNESRLDLFSIWNKLYILMKNETAKKRVFNISDQTSTVVVIQIITEQKTACI